MTAQKSAEVFQLLASIQKLGQGTSTKELAKKQASMRFNKFDLHRWEPDFIDGYELKTPTGKAITLRQIWDAYVNGENIALSGPYGSGKSTIAFHLTDDANETTRVKNRAIAAENEKALKANPNLDPAELEAPFELPYPIEHLSCHEETRTIEVLGDVDLVYDDNGNKKPVVRWGHVPRAWTLGRTLIAEEVDTAPAGVWVGTNQFFDGRTEETDIFLNGVQHLVKHKRFRFMATMNTLMQGENVEEYAGTQAQNGAWVSRFGYTVIVDYMRAHAEINLIIRKTGLDKSVATFMVEAANKSRESYRERSCDAPISTRDLLAWSREVVRAQKRENITSSSHSYMSDVVVPSAWPTFVCRQSDQATRNSYMEFLKVRHN